ncbi:MAG TPA: aldehyde dehydrogenase family protein [Tepidisphaeraceae bacterium]|jgi:aldehyde dehydrogenase (NAD+)|nr:aldehyde dehydrogenase family protein [Tepidisphaeraceae bacterium]
MREHRSPIDGNVIGQVRANSSDEVIATIDAAVEAFKQWRLVPAPMRGQFVRRVADRLRAEKSKLAAHITAEAGKITAESLGEVQEMIDIADFAVGLSRQLHGLTIASERPGHRMMEQWHPLGPIGVISAFNFPMAVWAWNAMIAWVCGDPVVWKPSEKTPMCAMTCQTIIDEVGADMPGVPRGISGLVMGGPEIGKLLSESEKIPLISATGSTRMGRSVAETVARRLGRTLLELGGNNGMILAPSADLDLATRAIVFAAAGTAGQRCTTLRRLIVHRSIAPEITRRLTAVYGRLKIGDPTQPGVLVGPLIDESALVAMQRALELAKQQGGRIIMGGERVTDGVPPGGFYVRPALVAIPSDAPIIREETFAPILYVIEYDSLDEAIAIHNDVPQGLSSAIFTANIREAETFLSPAGSDCGIANVNIGTSGAEIGGAFGGEKQTGGGRESGSDAWKAYMRRATNTVNYSKDLPLAQGIEFDV